MKRLTKLMKTLKGHNSFTRVISKGVKVKSESFVGFFVPNESEIIIVNFGISIPKKHAKKAVVRNRTKRLVKESLICLAKYDEDILLTFEEFVLIRTEKLPSHPKLISFSNVKAEIYELFDKAKMRIG